MKITTEIQQNVKLVRWLKEKARESNMFITLIEENKLHFRAKIGRGCTGMRHFTVVNNPMKNDPKLVKFDHNSRQFTLEGMAGNITGRWNPKWDRFELTNYQSR